MYGEILCTWQPYGYLSDVAVGGLGGEGYGCLEWDVATSSRDDSDDDDAGRNAILSTPVHLPALGGCVGSSGNRRPLGPPCKSFSRLRRVKDKEPL